MGEPWALVLQVGFRTLIHTLARHSFLLPSEALFIVGPHLPHCDPRGKPNFWGSFLFPPVRMCCVPAPSVTSQACAPLSCRGRPLKHPCCPRNDISSSPSLDTRILETPNEGPAAPATVQERSQTLSKGFPRIQGSLGVASRRGASGEKDVPWGEDFLAHRRAEGWEDFLV